MDRLTDRETNTLALRGLPPNEQQHAGGDRAAGMAAAATELLSTEHLEEDGVEGGVDADNNEYGWV